MKDNIIQENKWQFDKDVAECFDDMLNRSIPNYKDMRYLTTRIGDRFVKPETNIVDIGCSNGNMLLPFVKKYGSECGYTMIDTSGPMVDIARERYSDWQDVANIIQGDITECELVKNISVCFSVLTMIFIPTEKRQGVINKIYHSLNNGGCFVMVEKVMGDYEDTDNIFVDEYYKIKGDNGYTQEQIQKKRESLSGVLVPLCDSWNCEMLKKAGFRMIDRYWRYLNFEGYLAIK